MTESSKKMEDIYEEFSNQVDRINYLIKQFTDLEETNGKQKKDRYYWNSHLSTLSINIWAGQVKYLELQKKEASLKKAISKVTNVIDLKQQELKDLITKRTTYFTKQCDKFRVKGIRYTNNFLHAQTEYTNKNLHEQIEEFQKQYQQMYNELPTFTEKLSNLETISNSEETETALKVNFVLTNITTINTYKLLQITCAQNMLRKLENEIKQKRMILNNVQNK
ncbi:uncharacterized protein LOC132909597 [Bombus pascuorum]|uniref:uncharacterized protein LOC132909597 n=1 Tax=Bombus pascuorum TaxID=65598 RepID=UPI00213EB37E|nr:uncharacterized protein LOC132909597 [Bombus pascuorum]